MFRNHPAKRSLFMATPRLYVALRAEILPRRGEQAECLGDVEAPGLQAAFQFAAGVMQELVYGITVGTQAEDDLVQGYLVEDHEQEDLALFLRQIVLDDVPDELAYLRMNSEIGREHV